MPEPPTPDLIAQARKALAADFNDTATCADVFADLLIALADRLEQLTREAGMSVPLGHNLVRLGVPSKGDTIHRAECRYVQRPNALPWHWAEGRPLTDWTVDAPWLKACGYCRPDLPRVEDADA